MDMNQTIIGQSFKDDGDRPPGERGAGDDFDLEMTSGNDGVRGTEFSSDVVDGDFEPVVPKRRPVKLILAGVLVFGVLLAGGGAYTASIMQKPRASDIDFGALKAPSPTKVAAVTADPAPVEQAPVASVLDSTPVVTPAPPPPVGMDPAPNMAATQTPPPVIPVPLAVPASLPAITAAPPAGQGAHVLPAAPGPSIAKPVVPAVAPAAATSDAGAHSPKPAATPLAKIPVQPVAKASAAVVPTVKPIVKPAVTRAAQLVAVKSVPIKSIPVAKPLLVKPTIAAPGDDSNPLGADVRPLVTVTAEQIGMRAMSADAISLATAAGIQRFKVGDYLPSGDRVMHIDSPGATLVTDKKIIRVVN